MYREKSRTAAEGEELRNWGSHLPNSRWMYSALWWVLFKSHKEGLRRKLGRMGKIKHFNSSDVWKWKWKVHIFSWHQAVECWLLCMCVVALHWLMLEWTPCIRCFGQDCVCVQIEFASKTLLTLFRDKLWRSGQCHRLLLWICRSTLSKRQLLNGEAGGVVQCQEMDKSQLCC